VKKLISGNIKQEVLPWEKCIVSRIVKGMNGGKDRTATISEWDGTSKPFV
jgi:hypothetical protein